jgi:hypothetical protein
LINVLHGEEWLDDLAIAAMRASGLSLASMRDRLKLLKGEFSIDAQPSLVPGFLIAVPVNSENKAPHAPTGDQGRN